MKIEPSDYKILIVDDILSNVLLLRTLLGRYGYRTAEAMGGEEALELMKHERPDLLLLDVMMPGLGGFDVARRLKADPGFRDIPVIFLTALNDAQSIVNGFKSGGDDFVSKPFRTEELIIRVGHQLSMIAARRIIVQQTEELKKVIVSRDRLYSVIAHDLRLPMASMKMLLNTVMKGAKREMVNPNIVNLLEMTTKTSEEIFALLDNLLKWTKSQLGELSVIKQNTDLVQLTTDTIEIVGSMAKIKNITIDVKAPDSCDIFVDPEMIKCAIRNLLSNAIKFSHKGSIVRIYIGQSEKEAKWTVEDSGCGIRKEDQQKLLQEATHFTTYGTNNEEGSGLGLLLCQDFVQKNGGYLWFESEEKVGSKFGITLPR